MFKIGQRYKVGENKGTIHLVSKDKTNALIKYDNSSLGHSGLGYPSYYHDDNGNYVEFKNLSLTGYYFIFNYEIDKSAILINGELDYEIY